MKRLTTTLLCMLVLASASAQNDATNKYFELRKYYVHPGEFNALVNQFDQSTIGLFKKHRLDFAVGKLWTPAPNENKVLYYILAFPDAHAREKRWTAYDEDAERKTAVAAEKTRLVDSVTMTFMTRSDILSRTSPAGADNPVLELRTYTCLPGRLPNLIMRFKDHTLNLFERHRMISVAYFTTVEKDGVQPKLVYLLAHPSVEAAGKAWAEFRADPDWIAAKDASEKDGKIVGSVESVFLTAR